MRSESHLRVELAAQQLLGDDLRLHDRLHLADLGGVRLLALGGFAEQLTEASLERLGALLMLLLLGAAAVDLANGDW